MLIKHRKNINNFNNTYKHDITFVSIDGGCSFITYYMLKSFLTLQLNVDFYILCNKQNEYLHMLNEFKEYPNIKIFYDFNIIKKYGLSLNKPSHIHMASILEILKYVKTDYIFLCDNDIVFKENFKKYLDVYNNYDILEINNNTDLKSNINSYTTLMYCNFMFNEAAYTKFEKYSFNNSFYNKIIETDIKYNEVSVKTLDDNDNVVNLQFCIRYLPYFIFINLKKIVDNNITIFDKNIEYINYENLYFKDTFSTFTINTCKNNFNKETLHINDSIYHLGSSTFKNNINTYIKLYNVINNNNIEDKVCFNNIMFGKDNHIPILDI